MAESNTPTTNTESLITEHLDIWTTAIEQKSSAGRGSSKKFSLHGIKKLRELILELAVRGKLVPQDINDEPASVLLERIAAEKAQLIKDKKIKLPKALPEISEDEKPFELPKGWEWTRFIDLLDFSGGGQPPKSYFSEEKLDGYVQLIQIRDLGPNPQPVYIPQEKASKFCTSNDVMVGRYGASVGKVFWGKEGAYNVALIKIHNELGAFIPEYIFLLLKSPLGQSFFGGISRSAQDGFSKNDIAHKLIPFLCKKQQKRIVTKVDELMGLCDALEAQTENSIAAHQTLVEVLLEALLKVPVQTATPEQATAQFQQNWQRLSEHFDTLFTTTGSIDTLKQTILQLAVMGKLVPQNPADEPAAKLLERIAAEKAQLIKDKKIKKQKPLPEITDEEKPFELPEGWEWCRIFDVSLFTEYGTSEKAMDGADGIPVLKMGDIQGGKVFHGGQKVVPSTINDLPNLYLKYGDVLYNRTNSAELVGKTGMFEGEDDTFTFASYLIRIRCQLESVTPHYLTLTMNTPFFRKTQIDPHVKQQCGQANVNGTIMKSMLVPICSLEEQHRIVAKVDELTTLCDQLKARLTDAQNTKLHLTDAIVDQAVN
jgi:type I restriction enzyme S subunit